MAKTRQRFSQKSSIVRIWQGLLYSSSKVSELNSLMYNAPKWSNTLLKILQQIRSKSTIKTPERRQSRRSGVFVINYSENICCKMFKVCLFSLRHHVINVEAPNSVFCFENKYISEYSLRLRSRAKSCLWDNIPVKYVSLLQKKAKSNRENMALCQAISLPLID